MPRDSQRSFARRPVADSAVPTEQQPELDSDQSIKVAIRLRPLNDREISYSTKSKSFRTLKRDEADNSRAWSVLLGSPQAIVQKGTRKVEGKSLFHFDSVFDEDASTRQVYETTGKPIVERVLSGHHGTIFAYGSTGSGKTYTMMGGEPTSNDGGMIQMVADDLFRAVATHPERDFSISVSFIEIYNENLYELLTPDTGSSSERTTPPSSPQSRNTSGPSTPQSRNTSGRPLPSTTLIAREDPRRGGVVVNCKEVVVKDAGSLVEQLRVGSRNRVVASTNMNERTSRSHAIFRVTIESRKKIAENTIDDDLGGNVVRVSTLNLVDLAGSENSSSAGNKGTRHREAGKINQSLLALSQVVNALSLPPNKRPAYINYRDSKLTRILQPSLSGNALMAILCCATPSRLYIEETRSTFKFGARAKLVQTDAKINEVVDDGVTIKRLQNELYEARRALQTLERREAVSENTTSEANRELKQLKHLIFGMESLPDFASHDGNSRSHVPSSQRSTHSVKSAHSARSGYSTRSALSAPVDRAIVSRRPNARSPERRHPALMDIDEQAARESFNRSGFSSHLASSDQLARQNGDSSEMKDNRHPRYTEAQFGEYMDLPQSVMFNSIRSRGQALPGEVVVTQEGPGKTGNWGQSSIEHQLYDAKQRVHFLESKLALSEDLVESLFKDIEDAKTCIHQLVFKNVDFISKIKTLKAQLHEEERQADSLMVQQYNLLKFSIYVSLIFFIFGQHEMFLATIFFIWLTLEAYT